MGLAKDCELSDSNNSKLQSGLQKPKTALSCPIDRAGDHACGFPLRESLRHRMVLKDANP
eukprot:scaffold6686_cov73-Skeletonema_dohrnii-CCMP3373.AAC.2